MRATRAYIASAGTAAVMLGASVCVFIFLSAFVAFGSWPGSASQTDVSQIVLRSVQRPNPSKVTVRSDAVLIARRQAGRAARTLAAATPAGPAVVPVATLPGTPATRTPAPPVASAPGGGAGARSPAPSGGGTDVTKTTQQVGTQLTQQVGQVQTQVNQVVDQVIGGAQVDGGTGSTAAQQVQQAAGGLLGH